MTIMTNYDFTPTETKLINNAANKYYNNDFNKLDLDEREYLFNAWIKGRI